MVALKNIRKVISSHFPEKCAEDWDNPGLQLGRTEAQIAHVLTALELTREVIAEAEQIGADLIVTHHPFIFKPIKSVSDDSPVGDMLLTLAEKRIALLAAHTNLDASPNAVAQKLADDLQLTDRSVFLPSQPYDAFKIVTFVPEAHAAAVAQAMHEAGAGSMGQYTNTSFSAQGIGRFTCGPASHPAVGTPGSAEEVPEIRLEMAVSSRDISRSIETLRRAHPYEEPAIDVFKLHSEVHGITDLYGFGTIGSLPQAMDLQNLIHLVKNVWDIRTVRFSGSLAQSVRRVAIMNGSGARFLSKCAGRADVLITGDCGHHDFDLARRLGIALVDAGHYDTEKCIPKLLADVLSREFSSNTLKISVSSAMENPMKAI